MTQDRISEKFDRAYQFWHLERLYLDLANAKGRSLTPLEKQFLQGLLCGYSPAEIANIVYKNPNSSAVRVYLSNGLYRYIRELFAQKDGDTVRIKNWSCITRLLEKAGYRQAVMAADDNSTPVNCLGNGEHLDVAGFLGREAELARLGEGIQCYRLVTLLGVAGQGKTLLAAKLVQLHQERFECVVWRSLSSQPSLTTVLSEIIHAIAPQTELPATELEQLALLMNLLRSRRCLIVLDDFDGLFQQQQFAGTYQPPHQVYAQFLERLASERHQSCGLLLSREQPKEVAFLAASRPHSVLELCLGGLGYEDALQLPELQHIQGEEKQYQQFVRFYVNNTLVLKCTASLINTVCQGDLEQFCQMRTYVLSNIREFLENQFQRLHQSEQEFLYSLILAERLQQLGVESVMLEDKVRSPLDEIASLQRRLLLRVEGTTFQVPLLWQTYLIERLIAQTNTPLYRDRNTALLAEILRVSLLKPQFM